MSKIQFEFERQKTIEAMIYLASRLKEPFFVTISKLLYMVDKTSLESYGRMLTNDTYLALESGPVPDQASKIMLTGKFDHTLGFHVEFEGMFVPDRDPKMDEFSVSDVMCMDIVLKNFGHLPLWHIRQISQDQAWKKTRALPAPDNLIMAAEDIIATVDEDDALLNHLTDRS